MKEESLEIAFSSCPNDTFIYHAWAYNLINSNLKIMPTLLDIDELNHAAIKGRYPITKISTFCLGLVSDKYRLLESGCAISHKIGPKLIAKKPISSLKNFHVAIPGKETTANLLLNITLGKQRKTSVIPYYKIVQAVLDDTCDCGVLIHESGSSFDILLKKHGLIEVADLGYLFYKKYSCPIPLGVAVAKRDFAETTISSINQAIKDSLTYAYKNPKESLPYILSKSQEKEVDIVQKHIDLYVTKETFKISSEGIKAINILLEQAIDLKLLPKRALQFL